MQEEKFNKPKISPERVDFVRRLKALKKKRNLNQAELAKAFSMSVSYAGKLESGAVKPSDNVLHILAQMESSPIAGGRKDVMHDPQIVPLPQQVPILSYAQMGALTSYEELSYDDQKTYPADVDDPKAFALTLRGDSMEPDYKEGSIAVLRPSSEPQQHHPAVARLHDGSVVFKIYTREKDQIILRSINPAYDPIRVNASEVSWIYPVDSVHRILWK